MNQPYYGTKTNFLLLIEQDRKYIFVAGKTTFTFTWGTVAVAVSASPAVRMAVLGEQAKTQKVDDEAKDADNEDHLKVNSKIMASQIAFEIC